MSEDNNKDYNYDMYDSYYLILDPNTPTIPKWAAKSIHAVGKLDGNPSDPKRTTSLFESALSVKDALFYEKCYLIVESYPQTY